MRATELRPDLRLVRTSQILFHEDPERQRTLRLKARIEKDAVLRNPPVVAELEGGRFLLLDGANRVSAFQDLQYAHIPVQVVDYGDPGIQLKGWHHLFIDAHPPDLRATYAAIPGTRMGAVGQHEVEHLLEFRQVFAVLVEDEKAWWGIFPEPVQAEIEVRRRIAVLGALVGAYEGRSRLERIKLADFEQLPQVVETLQHRLCLFPVLHKEELLHLATDRVMIPTGLTRHVIPGRALGINLDLSWVHSDQDENTKTRLFHEYVDRLAIDGRIRYYEESVFLMNE
jgi:hypothetical protein